MEYMKYFNLQIFAEGGGDGGAGGAEGGGEATGAQAVETLAKSREAKNPLANVQYGKQETADPETKAEEVAPPDRVAEFDKLIKGEYKDLYDKKMQDTIKSRLKSTQETVDKYNKASPLFEALGAKYGVSDPTDIDALLNALEADSSFYEEEAMERGLTVEQLKDIKKMEKENAELKAEMRERQTREQANQLYARWENEAAECKNVYPAFDLQTELQNEQFRNLLMSNIPVQTAFEVVHKDEVLPAAMQFAAKQVEQKLTNKIISGGSRPNEGGVNNGSSAVVKTDVSKFTKADRQEIARRVAAGQRIVL